MRSYVFTPLERQRIRDFLDGKVPPNDMLIAKIRFRVRAFKELAEDVELYLRFREAVSAAST